MTTLAPTSTSELRDAIGGAVAAGAKLEIRAGGSKADIGAERAVTLLDLRGFCGVVDYDPAELVLTVKPGTPLTQIEALVTGENQSLAFEPWDHGPLFSRPPGVATIGGVIAAGVAGPDRLARGSARDHLLGFTAVSGRAEVFVAGGRVIKNVTGYDLPKLMAASWGRLAAMTELTLRVCPRPQATATMALEGLGASEAVAAMTRAMGSSAEVSAAAHLPAALRAGPALTLFRLPGFERSVVARCAKMAEWLRPHGALHRVPQTEADTLWGAVRQVAPLGPEGSIWRIHVPPSRAPTVVQVLEPLGAQWLFDWAGGLIWVRLQAHAEQIRATAAAAGGHATLVRAPRELRNAVPALHPRSRVVSALEARIRRAFDPAGVFETGRFLD